MDGIFGVGVPEMIIVLLVLFVVGGPENTAKWARELGRIVRQVREAWANVLAEVEQELGPEGKEIMGVARELGQEAREIVRMDPAKKMINETIKMVDSAVDLEAAPASRTADAAATSPDAAMEEEKADEAPRYAAWTPPGEG